MSFKTNQINFVGMSSSPDSPEKDTPATHESHSAILRLLATTERPTTYKVAPSTDLLSRLQNFLPEIDAANKALENVPQTQRDIEHVEEGMRHIEMNVQFYQEEEVDEGIEMKSGDENDTEDDDIVIVKSPKMERKDGMIVDMDVER